MKIGIIGAQIEEITPILDKLDRVEEKQVANQHFFYGTLFGHEIVLLQCGVGKVNAAIGTTLLCQYDKPDYIFNIGSAGAFSENLQIGDVIVSSEVRYHDVDLTPFGYVHGQMSQMPEYFEPDQTLVDIADKSFSDLTQGFHVKKGLIVSGDSFVTDPLSIKLPIAKDVECCAEMEACAIAQAAYLFNIPFLIIRSISDKIGVAGNKETYEQKLDHAAINASALVLRMVEQLPV